MRKIEELNPPLRLKSFEECQIKTPLLLKKWLGRELAPDRNEYAAMQAGLNHGDPAMDRLIHAVQKSGQAGRLWPRIHKAFDSLSLENQSELASAHPEIVESFNALVSDVTEAPFEIDWEAADRGAVFIHSVGTFATDVLRDLALMGGYLLSAFNKTLILTGELERGAAPRLRRTSEWWLAVTDPGANRAGKAGLAFTLKVRWGHGMVRNGLEKDERWNGPLDGLPINQVDMAATYLGFSLVMLLGLRKCGVYVPRQASKDVMHLWKVIGWQMGVASEWLVDSEREGIVLLRQFMMTHTPPDESTAALARALAEEPLQRGYPSFNAIQQRVARQFHLSSCAWLLGAGFMKKLQLKAPLGPGIKLLASGVDLPRLYLRKTVGFGRGSAESKGRLEQRLAVQRLAGGAPLSV